jgi:hypothetical protein
MSYRYQGMIIDPRASGPSIDNQWSAYVLIADLDGPEAEETEFHAVGRFKTSELALQAGFSQGKQKVDELRDSAPMQSVAR